MNKEKGIHEVQEVLPESRVRKLRKDGLYMQSKVLSVEKDHWVNAASVNCCCKTVCVCMNTVCFPMRYNT